MDYLIKDLAGLTGLSPARIRKWQERYGILEPKNAPNGYWYYSNDDLFVLKNVNQLLSDGVPLIRIMSRGRKELLGLPSQNNLFNPKELDLIRAISENKFVSIREELSKKKSESFEAWVKRLSDVTKMIGDAWCEGVLSIGDEHAFSFWLPGFFREFIRKFEKSVEPEILVVSFPGDDHSLGALLHYGLILSRGASARFCGMLPESELFRELSTGKYSEIHISIVVPKQKSEIAGLSKRIRKRFSSIRICFGGVGYEKIKTFSKSNIHSQKKKEK